MYEPGTILELKEPRPDVVTEARVDPDTGRKRPRTKTPFPYNRVKVIGKSPVQHPAPAGGEWSGTGLQGVLIAPLSSFGSTLDEPYGKLTAIYNVVEVPTNEVVIDPPKVVHSTTTSAGPTPEEVFAVEAPGESPKEGQTRGRTSPLPDPPAPADPSPL